MNGPLSATLRRSLLATAIALPLAACSNTSTPAGNGTGLLPFEGRVQHIDQVRCARTGPRIAR